MNQISDTTSNTPPNATPSKEGRDGVAPVTERRFLFVDAIRGVAAFGVVLRHLFYNPWYGHALESVFPLPLQFISIWGAAGVYAFFVLSGFVIAHSLRHNVLDRAGIFNFIIRRQIRLDPPYWAIIAVTLSVEAVMARVHHAPSGNSPLQVIQNMFYLQNIFGVKEVVPVAWTLCLEIQFYVIFILILKLGHLVPVKHGEKSNITPYTVGLVFLTGLGSLVLKQFAFYSPWFFSYWHYFAAGVLGYWAINRTIPSSLFGFYMAAFALSCVASPLHGINDFGTLHSRSFTGMLVGLVTSVALVYAGLSGRIVSWGSHPFFQYFGRISYSWYLTHHLIAVNIAVVTRRFGYEKPIVSLGTWVAALLISIICAHFFHLGIEKPSMKFAARLKAKPST